MNRVREMLNSQHLKRTFNDTDFGTRDAARNRSGAVTSNALTFPGENLKRVKFGTRLNPVNVEDESKVVKTRNNYKFFKLHN